MRPRGIIEMPAEIIDDVNVCIRMVSWLRLWLRGFVVSEMGAETAVFEGFEGSGDGATRQLTAEV